MRQNGNTLRLAAAAVIVMGGAAWAGNVYLQPVPELGPDPEQLKALAERLQPQRNESKVLLEFDEHRPRRGAATLPKPVPEPPIRLRPADPEPRQQAAVPLESKDENLEASDPAETDPVKNIALMGVTDRGGVERAWIVDLESKDRDPFEEGQEAYGFTVGDIRRGSVVLTRDGEEFVLRLGEKPIPSAYGDAPATPVTTASAAPPGQGARPQGRRGGQQNRSNRGRSNTRRRGNRGRNSNARRSGGNGNAIRNAMNAARRGGFGGFNRNNNSGGNQAQVSSNPQTARRRGIRLVGDAEPLPQPPAVTNPQTQRRRGNNNGNAFGAQNGNQRNQRRR